MKFYSGNVVMTKDLYRMYEVTDANPTADVGHYLYGVEQDEPFSREGKPPNEMGILGTYYQTIPLESDEHPSGSGEVGSRKSFIEKQIWLPTGLVGEVIMLERQILTVEKLVLEEGIEEVSLSSAHGSVESVVSKIVEDELEGTTPAETASNEPVDPDPHRESTGVFNVRFSTAIFSKVNADFADDFDLTSLVAACLVNSPNLPSDSEPQYSPYSYVSQERNVQKLEDSIVEAVSPKSKKKKGDLRRLIVRFPTIPFDVLIPYDKKGLLRLHTSSECRRLNLQSNFPGGRGGMSLLRDSERSLLQVNNTGRPLESPRDVPNRPRNNQYIATNWRRNRRPRWSTKTALLFHAMSMCIPAFYLYRSCGGFSHCPLLHVQDDLPVWMLERSEKWAPTGNIRHVEECLWHNSTNSSQDLSLTALGSSGTGLTRPEGVGIIRGLEDPSIVEHNREVIRAANKRHGKGAKERQLRQSLKKTDRHFLSGRNDHTPEVIEESSASDGKSKFSKDTDDRWGYYSYLKGEIKLDKTKVIGDIAVAMPASESFQLVATSVLPRRADTDARGIPRVDTDARKLTVADEVEKRFKEKSPFYKHSEKEKKPDYCKSRPTKTGFPIMSPVEFPQATRIPLSIADVRYKDDEIGLTKAYSSPIPNFTPKDREPGIYRAVLMHNVQDPSLRHSVGETFASGRIETPVWRNLITTSQDLYPNWYKGWMPSKEKKSNRKWRKKGYISNIDYRLNDQCLTNLLDSRGFWSVDSGWNFPWYFGSWTRQWWSVAGRFPVNLAGEPIDDQYRQMEREFRSHIAFQRLRDRTQVLQKKTPKNPCENCPMKLYYAPFYGLNLEGDFMSVYENVKRAFKINGTPASAIKLDPSLMDKLVYEDEHRSSRPNFNKNGAISLAYVKEEILPRANLDFIGDIISQRILEKPAVTISLDLLHRIEREVGRHRAMKQYWAEQQSTTGSPLETSPSEEVSGSATHSEESLAQKMWGVSFNDPSHPLEPQSTVKPSIEFLPRERRLKEPDSTSETPLDAQLERIKATDLAEGVSDLSEFFFKDRSINVQLKYNYQANKEEELWWDKNVVNNLPSPKAPNDFDFIFGFNFPAPSGLPEASSPNRVVTLEQFEGLWMQWLTLLSESLFSPKTSTATKLKADNVLSDLLDHSIGYETRFLCRQTSLAVIERNLLEVGLLFSAKKLSDLFDDIAGDSFVRQKPMKEFLKDIHKVEEHIIRTTTVKVIQAVRLVLEMYQHQLQSETGEEPDLIKTWKHSLGPYFLEHVVGSESILAKILSSFEDVASKTEFGFDLEKAEKEVEESLKELGSPTNPYYRMKIIEEHFLASTNHHEFKDIYEDYWLKLIEEDRIVSLLYQIIYHSRLLAEQLEVVVSHPVKQDDIPKTSEGKHWRDTFTQEHVFGADAREAPLEDYYYYNVGSENGSPWFTSDQVLEPIPIGKPTPLGCQCFSMIADVSAVTRDLVNGGKKEGTSAFWWMWDQVPSFALKDGFYYDRTSTTGAKQTVFPVSPGRFFFKPRTGELIV